MIDLNPTKLSYIFPLINYLTPHYIVEVQNEEIEKLAPVVEESNVNTSIISISIGLTILLSLIVRPLFDFLNFSSNIILNIIIILITNIPLFITKSVLNSKKTTNNIFDNKYIGKAFILPNLKVIIQNVCIYLFFFFFYIMINIAILILKESNIMYVFSLMIFLSIILFQNVFIYGQSTIKGKIGGIKWKR